MFCCAEKGKRERKRKKKSKMTNALNIRQFLRLGLPTEVAMTYCQIDGKSR